MKRLAMLGLLSLVSCVDHSGQMKRLLQAATDAAPAIDKSQEAAYEACLAIPDAEDSLRCGESVRETYAPIGQLYTVARDVVCAINDQAEGC